MIGIVQQATESGGFIFPPFAGWLILTYGWRYAYMVLGIITFIGMITAGFFLRRDPEEVGQLPDGMSGIINPEVKHFDPNSQGSALSFQEVIRTKQFWMIFGLYCCFVSAGRPSPSTWQPCPRFRILTDRRANVLAVLIGSSMFSRVGMGRVADTIGNRLAFVISFAATTVSLIWGWQRRICGSSICLPLSLVSAGEIRPSEVRLNF